MSLNTVKKPKDLRPREQQTWGVASALSPESCASILNAITAEGSIVYEVIGRDGGAFDIVWYRWE